MRSRNVLFFSLFASFGLATAQAAFIVEPHASGKANDHFSSTNGVPSFSTTAGTALGLTATSTAFGGNGTVDEYNFRYTPGNGSGGTDADNTVYTAGAALGTSRIDPPGNPAGVVADPQVATGLVGGASGTYKVFITWPASGNVDNSGSTVTVNSDGAPIVINPVNMNSTAANGPTPSGTAGANKWLLIGTVNLTAGNTYTVVSKANSLTFTSQRSAGVMWELQTAVPEPTSFILAGLACIGWLGARRRG